MKIFNTLPIIIIMGIKIKLFIYFSFLIYLFFWLTILIDILVFSFKNKVLEFYLDIVWDIDLTFSQCSFFAIISGRSLLNVNPVGHLERLIKLCSERTAGVKLVTNW